MISLKQIHYALAVQKTLHFKKAAEACSVSQSALSTALSEMEKQLGFPVFERDNKKVLVTPLGAQVLDIALNIKLRMDDLDKLAQAQKAPLSFPMSVGIIPTICPYLLPVVLPELLHRYPDFQLEVIEDQSHVLIDKVRSGEIDTAILALPFPHEGLLSFTFWEEDFYWVTHKDDKQANKKEIVTRDLAHTKLMLLKDGHCLKDHALAACKLPSDNRHSLNATSLNTLVQLIANKMGTTLMPEMALSQLVDPNPELVKLHLNEPGPHRQIAFIVRPNYTAINNIECLMTLFKQQLNNRPVVKSC